MDLGCNMEFNFPEPGQLNDAVFGGGNSSISDKLDLGTGQLLDTVTVTTQCVGHHENADKPLSASDFHLDLGPANDLVSTSDFPLVNPVSDIGTEAIEDCSEGYSIVNAALEGGGILPKQPIPSSNTLNLGSVTNIQPIQLNQANLLGMSAIQVIPIENMQLLSSIKSLGQCHNMQSSHSNQIQRDSPNSSLIQSNSPAAVLLGNVLLLQSLPGQISQGNLTYSNITSQVQQDITTTNQILQISNDPNTVLAIQSTLTANPICGKADSRMLDEGMTIKTLLQKNNRSACSQHRRQESSKCQENVERLQQTVQPCHPTNPLKEYMDKQTDTDSLSQTKEPSDNQKNTKILVYGKNIALTFDCRNQNFVMESLTKAMKGNGNQSTREVSIEIGNPCVTDLEKGVSECTNKSREVKYVSILNPPALKKIKTDSPTTLIPKVPTQKEGLDVIWGYQDKEYVCLEQQAKNLLTVSKETVSTSISKDSAFVAGNETEKADELVSVESGENSEKVAVLSVVKRDQKFEDGDQEEEDRLYKCDLCSASFSRVGNYTRHRMIHTVNTQDNYRYKCTECGRLFLQRCDMKRHMLIHTKQEPHRCTVCDKGYIRKSDLVVHMRFHSKERAYKCCHCEKQFFQSGDLNRHVRNVHLLAPLLKCGHCNRQFVKESTLIRHMQTTHKDIIIKSLQDKLDKSPSDKQLSGNSSTNALLNNDTSDSATSHENQAKENQTSTSR
ncbi:uncharacterized protein LOC144618846 isoform X2 [Crassostrea virginica]